jgi:hypothetical protein
MDQKSHDGNKEQSFAPLPPKPNGRNKSMGAHDRIPPDSANSDIGAMLHLPTQPFGTPHSDQIKKDRLWKVFIFAQRGTLGQLTPHRCPGLDLRKPDVASPAVVEPRWRRSSETRMFVGTGCARCPTAGHGRDPQTPSCRRKGAY